MQFTDLQAAAAWRVLSPLARRDAEPAMEDLVRADLQVLQAAAAAAAWDGGRLRDPAQAAVFDRLGPLQQRLQAQAAHTGADHVLAATTASSKTAWTPWTPATHC